MVDMQTLPFESSSINAILLHHTLDIYEHPHQLLREVERVLVPGGRLTLIGFNPWSLWGIASRFLRVVSLLIPSSWVDCCGQYWFWESRYLSKLRLKDWLQLLNFEIDEQLTFSSSVVPEVNKRFCRHFGPLYLLSGVKRANCMTPIKPRWRVPSKRFGAVAISLTTVRQTASTNHSQ
jgi:SAM-dependent methyltransferase